MTMTLSGEVCELGALETLDCSNLVNLFKNIQTATNRSLRRKTGTLKTTRKN